ncbi:patatin-like phospholipase family protein [Chlorobium sp.]|uniref:patatin-like phospholipase family protein n=1 Tax=Chlorobium sp. TaxID=1095 RepID=UPI002F40767A
MSIWGKLSHRFENSEPRKHRLLALDGGGIRGVLTLEILRNIESLLADATGKGSAFRLSDYFDYVAGTSTGAIIAAGIARGMKVDELLDFYEHAGPDMFDKNRLLQRWYSLYKSDPLEKLLKKTFGPHTTLKPDDLNCLFLAVTLNRTTDSPWPISSNPLARYNELSRPDCNLSIPLWKIVRASTAAPVFFPPEVINWCPGDNAKSFVFVDGGMTPYNNPAFLLYRMATDPVYRLGWPTGETMLQLVSVGTGSAPRVEPFSIDPERGLLANAMGIPLALMYGAMVDQDVNCRHIGRCVHGDCIDREIGDMIPVDASGARIPFSENLGRRFLYARYDAALSSEALCRQGFDAVDPEKVRKLDAVTEIENLRKIGRKAAEQVSPDHFRGFIP